MPSGRCRLKKLIAAVTVLAVSTAQADTIYVDVDCPDPGNGSEAEPYCSIQTAIDNAVDTDEVVVAPGTYFEAINFIGKAIWLHSSDGAKVTTIYAGGAGTVVTCNTQEGPDTVLEGFTVTGGNANNGGGMYNLFGSSPTVTDCTFTGNSAGTNGGGIDLDFPGFPTVTGCLFSGNSAKSNGGGMYNSSSTNPTVANCTFEGNLAMNGDAIALDTNPSFLTMANCVLWNGGDEIWNNNGSTVTVVYSDIQGGWPGIENIDADPMFVDPINGDYRLSPNSPCIDAGDNIAVPKFVLRDLDGNPRFVADVCAGDSGATVDMGAYEFQGTSCDLSNILAMLASWGSCRDCGKCFYDFDGDGTVGINDLLILLGNWGVERGASGGETLIGRPPRGRAVHGESSPAILHRWPTVHPCCKQKILGTRTLPWNGLSFHEALS